MRLSICPAEVFVGNTTFRPPLARTLFFGVTAKVSIADAPAFVEVEVRMGAKS
jgi:hypothetical protein